MKNDQDVSKNQNNIVNNVKTAECLPQKKAINYYEFTVKLNSTQKLTPLGETDDVCRYMVARKDNQCKCENTQEKETSLCKTKENACCNEAVENVEKSKQTKSNEKNGCNTCSILCKQLKSSLRELASSQHEREKKFHNKLNESNNGNDCSCDKEFVPNLNDLMSAEEWDELLRLRGLNHAGNTSHQAGKDSDKSMACDNDSESIDFDKYNSSEYERKLASVRKNFWANQGADAKYLGLRGIYESPKEHQCNTSQQMAINDRTPVNFNSSYDGFVQALLEGDNIQSSCQCQNRSSSIMREPNYSLTEHRGQLMQNSNFNTPRRNLSFSRNSQQNKTFSIPERALQPYGQMSPQFSKQRRSYQAENPANFSRCSSQGARRKLDFGSRTSYQNTPQHSRNPMLSGGTSVPGNIGFDFQSSDEESMYYLSQNNARCMPFMTDDNDL